VQLSITKERWELRKPFVISRQTYTHIDTILVELSDGSSVGRGEAAGVDYHGETVDSMAMQIEEIRDAIERGIDRDRLAGLLGAGGARNAVDCALWDLEAKQSGRTVWDRVCPSPRSVTTVYTVGLGNTADMALDAEAHRDFPVIKVKVGRGDPIVQLQAVHAVAPDAELVIDANQGWTVEQLRDLAPRLVRLGVRMIEQPLPAGEDELLRGFKSPVILCADESCQTSDDLEKLAGLYGMLNIKLDKTGGLTEALELMQRARHMGFELMVGNMLGTSLAMAPAFVIAQSCRYVHLDGPLLQVEDREHGLRYERGHVTIPAAELWG